MKIKSIRMPEELMSAIEMVEKGEGNLDTGDVMYSLEEVCKGKVKR